MRCYHCGQEIPGGSAACMHCGANQGAGATVVLDGVYNPYAAAPESGRTEDLAQPIGQEAYSGYSPARPVIQLPVNRSLLKMVLLGLLTFGIYDIVIWCKMITELNIVASRYDGKRTMPYFAMIMLAPLTLGIYGFVWSHKLCGRIGAEVARRGYDYKFGASTFWIWNVLGSLILVGPFVYLHKLTRCMNIINGDFNECG